MRISPFILGSGRAAQALTEAWAVLGIAHPKIGVGPVVKIGRGDPLPALDSSSPNPVLCIANPPGLHARAILDGERAGFALIVVEKPACVSMPETDSLRAVRTPVAVCHVYRQTWGVQTLKRMIAEGEFGDLIAIEGRYWQSSAAQRAIGERAGGGWKNDAALSGPRDALLDVGTHWVDVAMYLSGSKPLRTSAWLSYANSEAPHRDTHVHLQMEFQSRARAFASISKTVHGATNHFEVNVIGRKRSATWRFLAPDELEVGSGSTRTIVARKTETASRHPAFHGLGWVEGYVDILHNAVLCLGGETGRDYPRLQEHLDVVTALLTVDPR